MTSTIESNDSIKNVSINDTKVLSVEERLEDVNVLRHLHEVLGRVVTYEPYKDRDGNKCVPKNWDECKGILINDEEMKDAIYLSALLSAKTNEHSGPYRLSNGILCNGTALSELSKRVDAELTKKEKAIAKAQQQNNQTNNTSGRANNSPKKTEKSEFELIVNNDVYINTRKTKLGLSVGNPEQLKAEINARIDELEAKYMAAHPEA